MVIKKLVLLVLAVGSCFAGCESKLQSSAALEMAIRMSDSQIKRYPQPWLAESRKGPYWGYTEGLVSLAYLRLWEITGTRKYYETCRAYADSLIADDGSIRSYKRGEYNIDNINSGRILFQLYSDTKNKKYLTAMQALRDQMNTHPRTSEGGFWHKLKYPDQMWLDGIYMGSPYLSQYSLEFGEPALMDDVANQILTIQKHTYDPRSGLNFHGWDESRQQKWANPVTGQSPNLWGRSIGWYCMGIVDVLDYLPETHSSYNQIKDVFRGTVSAMIKLQDPSTGTWYQVPDQPQREGNYRESTVTSMMVYSILKGVRMGYLEPSFLPAAKKAYDGILKNFIREDSDGTISLTNCCSVAGLGGNPYRDGSFGYYISEPVRDNDPKGVGPFIMASIEMHLAGTSQHGK